MSDGMNVVTPYQTISITVNGMKATNVISAVIYPI